VTAVNAAAQAGASRQAAVDAALVLLERLGLSPADLLAVSQDRPGVPTFAEYIPVVSAAVSAGTRRAYGSYWNRVLDHWGDRQGAAARAEGPGGQPGNGSVSSAAGSHPGRRLFGQVVVSLCDAVPA
jgi:hypothetical protein